MPPPPASGGNRLHALIEGHVTSSFEANFLPTMRLIREFGILSNIGGQYSLEKFDHHTGHRGGWKEVLNTPPVVKSRSPRPGRRGGRGHPSRSRSTDHRCGAHISTTYNAP